MNNNKKSKDSRRQEIERRILGNAVFNNEVLEIILNAVHDETQAQVISKRLTDHFKGVGRILGQEIDDLKTIEGVTDSTVAIIHGANKLVNMVLKERIEEGPIINWKKLTDYLQANIGYSGRENLKIMLLNKRFHLIGEETYVGAVGQVSILIMEIIRKAILARATSIIISHNQPGGTVKPSERDKAMTKELASACATIGIKLADHIIVAGNNRFSFKENGLL
ncbi:MAG: DNA repair protein RadC [Rickettsiales bacterium]|jgi:DNA repair protein RadC|nr:DNA repair protein RadC [Rickettsiales bacterium]MDR1260895.1 DNA repair protein RadC [Rickettsiales bacterium]